MKRRRLKIIAATAGLMLAASAVAVAAGSQRAAREPYSVAAGTPVPLDQFAALARDVFAYAGGVRTVAILDTRGDRTFYRIAAASGDTCYAMGNAGLPRQLGLVGCLDGDNLTTPLIDMSTIVVEPSSGSVVRVARVEGVAADQVARVAVEVSGVLATETLPTNNVYSFNEGSIPAGATAIVALDSSGTTLWRKPLRG